MKKIAVLCFIASVCVAPAFAQLSVSAYAQSFWVPYRLTVPSEGDAQHTTAIQVPWGGPDLSAGASFEGWSEFGGLHLGLDIAYGAQNQTASPFSVTGGGWVWVKPLGFVDPLKSLTLYLGNPYSDQLSGKITGSSLVNYVLDTGYNKHYQGKRLEYQEAHYNVFTRIDPYSWGNSGAEGAVWNNTWWPRIAAAGMITYEPVDRLFIGVFFAPEAFILQDWKNPVGGASYPTTKPANGDAVLGDEGINQDYHPVKQVYRNLQLQVGYEFKGIGLARLQWIGFRNVVEAAFQVKALGDLVLDIGLKIPFESLDEEDTLHYKRKRDYQASVAATYRNYDFRLTGHLTGAIAGSDSTSPVKGALVRGLDLLFYLIPSYQFEIGTVGADLGFEYEQKDDINGYVEDGVQAGLALWFSRDMGNAKFRAAAVSRFPLAWKYSASAPDKSNFELFFPITVEIGF